MAAETIVQKQLTSFRLSGPDERQSAHDHTKRPRESLAFYRTLRDRLAAAGAPVVEMAIDLEAFAAWLARFAALEAYYRRVVPCVIEKCLEHYLTYRLCGLRAGDVLIDIAAAGSPWAEIIAKEGVGAYRLDLAYPQGTRGIDIGADATATGLADGCASVLSLHCAYECFMGDADIRLFREAARILVPGGRMAIAPLYLDDIHFVATSPHCDQRQVIMEPEAKRLWRDDGYPVPFSRHYSPESLVRRVLSALPPELESRVYWISNLEAVMDRFRDDLIYCCFALFLQKRATRP